MQEEVQTQKSASSPSVNGSYAGPSLPVHRSALRSKSKRTQPVPPGRRIPPGQTVRRKAELPGRSARCQHPGMTKGLADASADEAESPADLLASCCRVLYEDWRSGGGWGSHSAFVAYAQASKHLRRYSRSLVFGCSSYRDEVADEIAAHTLGKVFAVGCSVVEQSADLAPYAITVAKNATVARLKADAKARRRQRELRTEPADRAEKRLSPFDEARLERVRQLTHVLSEQQREAIEKRHFDGQSIQAIAEGMGLSPREVSRQIEQAKERLRRSLGASRRKPR